MMKAIFKPEDANKLIVRDADTNEASLITNFLDKIKLGAPLEAQPVYNGNYEINGVLLTVGDVPAEKPEVTIYLPVEATVTNDLINLPLFRIKVKALDTECTSFKVDEMLFDSFKALLEKLKLENISVLPDGTITAENNTGTAISATIVIPRGLFQYVNASDSSTLNYNDNLAIDLIGE